MYQGSSYVSCARWRLLFFVGVHSSFSAGCIYRSLNYTSSPAYNAHACSEIADAAAAFVYHPWLRCVVRNSRYPGIINNLRALGLALEAIISDNWRIMAQHTPTVWAVPLRSADQEKNMQSQARRKLEKPKRRGAAREESCDVFLFLSFSPRCAAGFSLIGVRAGQRYARDPRTERLDEPVHEDYIYFFSSSSSSYFHQFILSLLATHFM